MTRSSRSRIFLRIALAPALAAVPFFAASIAAQDSSPGGNFTLPENLQIYGKNDPDNRRATVIINGEIITGTDIDHRVALIVSASEGKIGEEELKRLRLQVLRGLMDETLQIQESKAQEVAVEEAEVEETFARVARQNGNQTARTMEAYLTKIGSSAATLKRQIRGELSWQRLLRRNVEPFVNVSDEEVREILKRLNDAKGTEELRVGEIFLSATAENRTAVLESANRIVEQLKQGGNFAGYARQYSEASTKPVGGDLGWLRPAQLPTELADAARTMQAGQLAGPIELRGGFSIIYLIDRRQVLTADPRDAVLSVKQVAINFTPGTTEAQATERAKQFGEALQGARGCGNLDAVAAQIGAEVVTNDQLRARDVPNPLQDILLGLSLGESTPPFGSMAEGVRVLMLCGRDDPKVEGGPDFETVQRQMEEERINKRGQAYLRDLRRDAVIDYD